MKKKTYLAEAIETADMKAQYDAQAKRIVADRGVLSWIVKYTVRELKDCTLEEIAGAIGQVEVAKAPVYPGRTRPEAVAGMQTQDTVPNEGTVTYDIRFSVTTPGRERIRLIVNIEIQRKYHPGYDLVERAVFYCARMLSAQLGTEFGAEDYGGMHKVYSIWLCLNAPGKEADTVTEYRLKPEILYGTQEAGHRYDLLSVVMIGLNEESRKKKATPLHGFLGTVFSEKLKPEEKLKSLEKDYGVETTRELKEGVNRMCNLSDAIEERGIQRGLQQGEEQKLIELICRKVRKGKTLEVIAEELEEDAASISGIYDAVLKTAPDYDSGKAYKLLHNG